MRGVMIVSGEGGERPAFSSALSRSIAQVAIEWKGRYM